MRLTKRSERLLKLSVFLTLAFIYIPLLIVFIYSFNADRTFNWPPDGLTFNWYSEAVQNKGAKDALVNSLKVGAAATAIALVLGTLAALAVSRHRFFGRQTISFLVVLPIALPGIITGIALNDTFTQVLGVDLSLLTVVVAHATFCIVVVFNNVSAACGGCPGSFEEASADLGAHTWQTFWLVTLPNMKNALVAGALLAFALSFDEIIVTNFTIGNGEQTLPIWIFSNLFRPNQPALVYAVASIVIVLSAIPVYLAQRLTRGEDGPVAGRGGGRVEAQVTAVP